MKMVEINLCGKIALVTGATGQLGRVIVRTLAKAGADIAVHYGTNRNMAEQLVKEIREMGQRAIAVQADVTDVASVIEMKNEICSLLGNPNIVISGAVGYSKPWVTVLEQPIESYITLFKTCVLQSVNVAKAFLPAMMEAHCGRFIGINTEGAAETSAEGSAYSSAKRGMNGVFRVLAKEVAAYNITVNEVAPGWTISDVTRQEGEDDAEYIAKIPMGRRGTDEEIANAVLFLASDLASYITGVYLPVCGGTVIPGI
ncbi:SDR family NAD(P)-dependent oxidoreductase [Yeguia hominis]|nr:SDR family oxidoreductase [Yeguia hominis]